MPGNEKKPSCSVENRFAGRLANAFHVSVDTLLEGVVEYEMVQTLLNDTSEQLLAQELLQVVKRYIREAEK